MHGKHQFITIARVARVQGRRGEVIADLHTSFARRFSGLRHVFALAKDGARQQLELESHRLHKGRVILKFCGVENISQAGALIGAEIQVPQSERLVLDAGAYVSDLVGCTVCDGGKQIGRIADVRFGAGDAPLLVIESAGREFLLPFAAEYLRRLDISSQRVEMALPEGLLHLDAPLSEQEKREQRKM